MATTPCAVCGQIKTAGEMIPGILVRPEIDALIRKNHAGWTLNGTICNACLNRFRTDYVLEQVQKDRGDLSDLEREVVDSIHQNQTVADNLNKEFETKQTTGAKVADKVAEFGGSWKFIFIFFSVMAIWIVINSIALL